MALVYKIQEFLEKKFNELKLKRKDFVEQSGIPYSTITHIMKGLILNPTINHILKIANYFNCSLDEVIGRTQYALPIHTKNFRTISSNDISNNLKKYIKDKVKKQNINLYTLGRDIGFSNNSLRGFNDNREQKIFNSQIIIALADYFQVSLDEMVGRVDPAISDNDEPSQQHTNE
ncbi:helix-turn-helix domain-containing protein [Rickettsia endosymbiont of Oedothorax gibbosus]|uniref:helix-turn-helix domain-containing protein n=1 Tax=Rickettsia endosymbiont of Oedothorax gibbosus TaxID=931099 RepID=UPI002025AD5A|nr:helix-turn-helix transcriptional regulator [Rickettsia endosymbiont of Oedothorax gibbosus]